MNENNISCEVIKDLLPLFIDGVCSDESNKLVSEHIEKCDSCSKDYKELMSKPLKMIANNTNENESLKKVGKKLKKDRKKTAIKSVAVTLAVLIVIGILILPDIMIALAKKEYDHGMGTATMTMNVYNHKDGKLEVGRVKLNVPEKYTTLENGLHIERNENTFGVYFSSPDKLETTTNQRINVLDWSDNPTWESPKLDFSPENSGGQNAISRFIDRIGARKLGFSENEPYEFLSYLCEAQPPEYSFFSSFGKKAAAFTFYDCSVYMLPTADRCFTFETDSYKCYGFAMQSQIDGDFIETDAATYTFELYDKDLTVMLIGFTKSEAESIMSSIVIE